MSCPPETPYRCPKKTLERGLCVTRKSECGRRISSQRPVPRVPSNTTGQRYGYEEANLGRSCYLRAITANIDYEARYDNGEPVPDSFSFMTYNIWGLAKKEEHRHLFRLRKNLLIQTIRDADADLCFMQEMSEFSYGELAEPLINTYKFASETPYPATGSTSVANRKRSVEVYCLSKYQPSRIRIIGIEGVLGYKNSFMIVEYPNLVVFNLYNQAGSKKSHGQIHKWLHYSRCRFDILQTLYDIMESEFAGQNIILCGDFNFDLDGSRGDWPEVAMLRRFHRMGFVDTFRQRNPHDPGYTEDTDLNFMRWNQKFIEKKYRFDAVLARGPWVIHDSRLIGTESQLLDPTESEWFLKHMSEFVPGGEPLRGTAGDLIPINPSDHFGVLTKFGARGGARKTRRRFRRSSAQTRSP